MTVFDEFNDLKTEMEKFSRHFETDLTAKRTLILQERQNHQLEISDLAQHEQRLNNDIAQLTQKEGKVKESIKKSLEDLQVQSLKVDELRLKHADLVRKRDDLQASIDEVNHDIKSVSDKITLSKNDLEDQNNRDYPELLKYEQYLGLRIEVVAVDLLKFVFTNVDPNDYTKEVWVELAVGGYKYEVKMTLPELSKDTKNEIEDDFNQHKSFIQFLKRIRKTLRDTDV